jgi:hypothetical protein
LPNGVSSAASESEGDKEQAISRARKVMVATLVFFRTAGVLAGKTRESTGKNAEKRKKDEYTDAG